LKILKIEKDLFLPIFDEEKIKFKIENKKLIQKLKNKKSGNGNDEKLNSIIKLNYFENKNLKIKKIVCGGFFSCYCNIFLTGLFK
jgi:hypothetical protein